MVLLVGMCVYSAIVGPKRLPAFTDFLKDPERFDGARFMVQFTMISEYKGPDRFTVADLKWNQIEVMGKIPRGNKGCFISFEATFKSPGYLVLGERWHIYTHDTAKLVVSAPALLGVVIFFLRRFRLNLGRLRFEERA